MGDKSLDTRGILRPPHPDIEEVKKINTSGTIREQDRLLPIASVSKIMRRILPPCAKISMEAKQTMQECASEFIMFVTGEASQKCEIEKRKTINGDDIVSAMAALGFDKYEKPLKAYLKIYREMQREMFSLTKQGLQDQPVSAVSSNDMRLAEEHYEYYQQLLQPWMVHDVKPSTDPEAERSNTRY